jgi:DNA-binding PadR family transcriptional regulator
MRAGRGGPAAPVSSRARKIMKRHWFFILLSLASEDRHGSDIMRDVLDLTVGDLRLWPATLYGSLEELREHGWIEELDDPAERPDGASERKRFYRITAPGRQALSAEARRLSGIVEAARERLAGDLP